jgi:hypothetical protein
MCSCCCIFPHQAAVEPVSGVGKIFLFISHRTVGCGLLHSRTQHGSAL